MRRLSQAMRWMLPAGALALAGCGIKLVDLGPVPNLYDVTPQVHFAGKLAPVSWQLIVDEPVASTSLDTDRILVRPGSNEVKYFANARWTARAPSLVQSHLIQAFDQSGAIIGVGRQTIAFRGDYDLQGELRAFDAVYSGGTTPMAQIIITLKIVRQPSEQIIASRTFQNEERATDASLPSIATSFQDALGKLLDDAVPWVLATAQQDYETSALKFHPAMTNVTTTVTHKSASVPAISAAPAAAPPTP